MTLKVVSFLLLTLVFFGAVCGQSVPFERDYKLTTKLCSELLKEANKTYECGRCKEASSQDFKENGVILKTLVGCWECASGYHLNNTIEVRIGEGRYPSGIDFSQFCSSTPPASSSSTWIWITVVVALVAVGISLYLFRDKLPFIGQKHESEQQRKLTSG